MKEAIRTPEMATVKSLYNSFKISGRKVGEYEAFITEHLLEWSKQGKAELSLDYLDRFVELNNIIVNGDKQTWIDRTGQGGTDTPSTASVGNIAFFEDSTEDSSQLPLLRKCFYSNENEFERYYEEHHNIPVDPYFRIMAFFLNQYFHLSDKNKNEQIIIRDCDGQINNRLIKYMESTYNLNKRLGNKKLNLTGCFAVPSEFEAAIMNGTYKGIYPNIGFNRKPPQGNANFIFDIMPFKIAASKTESHPVRHELNYSSGPQFFEEEAERLIEEMEVDYEKLEEQLKNHSVMKGGFLAIRSLEHEDVDEYGATVIAEVDTRRILDILERTNWSLVLIGNSFADFFVLQKPVKGQAEFPVAFLKDFESLTRETDLIEVLEACHKSKDFQEIVHILDNSLLTGNDFEAILDQKRAQDVRTAKVRQGFLPLKGIDCIDSEEYYDPESDLPWEEKENAIYLPRNNKLLPEIGICYSISEICKKYCDARVAFKDLSLQGIPWYDYCQTHEAKYFREDDRFNTARLDRWEELNDDWFFEDEENCMGEETRCHGLVVMSSEYLDEAPSPYTKNDLAFLFAQHDLSIHPSARDGVYVFNDLDERYHLRWRIRRNDYEKGYTKYRLLVSQIIRANVVRAILNPNKILLEYLQLFLQTKAGEQVLKQWYAQTEGTPLDAFKDLAFVFPKSSEQRTIVTQYRLYDKNLGFYRDKMNSAENGKKSICKHIGESSPVYLFPEDISEREEKESMDGLLSELPQPLASILYLVECEHEQARKIKDLLDFYEATAIFHATVVASVLFYGDRDSREGARKILVEKLKVQNTAVEEGIEFNKHSRISFGTWTSMLDEMLQSFSNELEFVFEKNTHNHLISFLHKGRIRRNLDSAHACHHTETVEERIYDKCRELATSICQSLAILYEGTELLYDCHARYAEQGKAKIEGLEVSGANPRLKYVQLTLRKQDIMDEEILSQRLYIRLRDGRLIPLLPFLRYSRLTDNDPSLLSAYYLNQIVLAQKNATNSYTNWRSFDCGDVGTQDLDFDDINTHCLLETLRYI